MLSRYLNNAGRHTIKINENRQSIASVHESSELPKKLFESRASIISTSISPCDDDILSLIIFDSP